MSAPSRLNEYEAGEDQDTVPELPGAVSEHELRKYSDTAPPPDGIENGEKWGDQSDTSSVTHGPSTQNVVVVPTEESLKDLHENIEKFPILYYTLVFCGLTYTPKEKKFFRYLYPAFSLCMVLLCNGQWQSMILIVSGNYAWSAVSLLVLCGGNWVFLKWYISKGALGLILELRDSNPKFIARVRNILKVGLFLIIMSQLVAGTAVGNYLAYSTYYRSFGYQTPDEPYILNPGGVITWHVVLTLSTMYWTASLFMFFIVFFIVCDSHTHELEDLCAAIHDTSITVREAVDWHKGIANQLKLTNEFFGWITAPYILVLLVTVLFFAAFGLTRSGATQVQIITSACLLGLFSTLLFFILFPAARVTAAAESIHAITADMIATLFSTERGGLQHAFSTAQTSTHGGVSQRSTNSNEGRTRGQTLRVGVARFRNMFKRRKHKHHGLHHENTEEEFNRYVTETWSTENSTFFLTYVRSAGVGFQIANHTISHNLNFRIVYTFASLILVFSRLN